MLDGVDLAYVLPYQRPITGAMFQSWRAVSAYDGRAEHLLV